MIPGLSRHGANMEEERTNPAARLHRALTLTLNFSGGDRQRNVWAAVLDVAADDALAIYRRLAVFADVLDDIENQLKPLWGNHALFMKPLDELRIGLKNVNLDGDWNLIKAHFNATVLARLEHLSDQLSRGPIEVEIPEEKRTALQDQLNSFRDLVLDLPGDHGLKVVLLDLVEEIQGALNTYSVRGVKGLKLAWDHVFGEAFARKEDFEPHRGSELMRKFRDTVLTLQALINLGQTGYKLLEPALEVFRAPSVISERATISSTPTSR